jgi:hypothetical protein
MDIVDMLNEYLLPFMGVLLSGVFFPAVLLLVFLHSRYKQHSVIINQHYRNKFLLNVCPQNTIVHTLDNTGRIHKSLQFSKILHLLPSTDFVMRLKHIESCLIEDIAFHDEFKTLGGIEALLKHTADTEMVKIFNYNVNNTCRFFFNIKLLLSNSREFKYLLSCYKEDPDYPVKYYQEYLTVSY